MPTNLFETAVTLAEYSLLIIGLVLGWRFVLGSAARARARETGPALPPWNTPLADFLVSVFLILGGGLLASFACGVLLGSFHLAADTKAILGSAAFQFGLLIGPALLPLNLGHPALRPPLSRAVLKSGLVTFLIALPIVTAVNLTWLELLKITGLPSEQQDLLRMFTQTDSTALLALMAVLATMVAPVAEELLFRATIFRYVRTRLPRWIALLLPGIIFAALHVNWATLDGLPSFAPLIMLAVVFSVAYERTGWIATPMIAHALFNLHTILLLFAGVTT